ERGLTIVRRVARPEFNSGSLGASRPSSPSKGYLDALPLSYARLINLAGVAVPQCAAVVCDGHHEMFDLGAFSELVHKPKRQMRAAPTVGALKQTNGGQPCGLIGNVWSHLEPAQW